MTNQARPESVSPSDLLDDSVSVIIATNRGGPFLAEAVASVRAQSRPVSEIVLVDDGAPDPGLRDVAEALGLTYLRQDASGVSAARNSGVEISRGRWLAFLDDDDVWHPERIALQVAALDARTSAIAAHGGGWHMDADGRDLHRNWGAPAAGSHDMLAGRVDFPRITTLLVDRTAFRAVGGFDPAMRYSEDNDLMLRLLQVGEFAAVDAPLVGYRRHEDNVTNHIASGYAISRDMLRRHRDAARQRGDRVVAALLSENLTRFRARVAQESVGEAISAARAGDLGRALTVTFWLVVTMPLHTVKAVIQRVSRRRTPARRD